MASAIWYEAEGAVTVRTEAMPPLVSGHGRVRTLFSGISRGTERLVLGGDVPASEWTRMRAPLQAGDFPFPVKYGYSAVGVVEAGPPGLTGRTVFCLHPHQSRFDAPVCMLIPVPDGVPARRATLAANMETALNALWDADAGPADRIAVIGAGVVGLLIAYLASRLPGTEVTVCDIDASRAEMARSLGVCFAEPSAAPADCDVVFHASATEAGLATALTCAGVEAAVIELSWYGDRPVAVPLGGAFHARRLRLVASQVGMVAPGRRPRWPHARRLAAALALLRDARLDVLTRGTIEFGDAPRRLPAVLAQGALGLAPVIRYPGASEAATGPA
ncbi:zinc-dependent alcohol dehydrogenase [Rhodopila sp.]|uniref:zinc-dependent alcohol dehydrogenase n=1 Tax=Rhodopila sp. TaxID=2480087 RepID=UPI002BB30701|nr:zinc-binding alcohol dehydrogenase [Rhodopila sp.]HVZ07326.1 zinc-binding alcohol dehydrogenase [Rhodopila sp.]